MCERVREREREGGREGERESARARVRVSFCHSGAKEKGKGGRERRKVE